jgi:hypothetical protein
MVQLKQRLVPGAMLVQKQRLQVAKNEGGAGTRNVAEAAKFAQAQNAGPNAIHAFALRSRTAARGRALQFSIEPTHAGRRLSREHAFTAADSAHQLKEIGDV